MEAGLMRRLWLLVLALCALLMGCVSEGTARTTLDDEGYTDVAVTGHSFWACGQHELLGAKFEATNARGKRIEGVVCCGVLKACTVRH